MKKVLVVLLALVMVFSFAACGGGGDDGERNIGAESRHEDESRHHLARIPSPAYHCSGGSRRQTLGSAQG